MWTEAAYLLHFKKEKKNVSPVLIDTITTHWTVTIETDVRPTL